MAKIVKSGFLLAIAIITLSVNAWADTQYVLPVGSTGSPPQAVEFVAYINADADNYILTENAPSAYEVKTIYGNPVGIIRVYTENFVDEQPVNLSNFQFKIHIKAGGEYAEMALPALTAPSSDLSNLKVNLSSTSLPAVNGFSLEGKDKKIAIKWDVQSGVTYKIFRGVNATGYFKQIKANAAPTYFDTGSDLSSQSLVNGQTYYYLIVAEDSAKHLVHSSLLSAIPQAGINNPPVATSQDVSTDEDVKKIITLNVSDQDGDELTFPDNLITPPQNGSIGKIYKDGSDGTYKVEYTPKQDFYGVDTLTYKANDGAVDSASATVNITINAVNDAPVMKSAEITTTGVVVGTEKLTAVGTATDVEDTDASNIIYSYQWKKNGADIAGQTASTLTKGNYVKGDKITVVITPKDSENLEGAGKPSTNTVEIGNTAPMATGKEFTIQEDQSLEITLSGTDADGAADIKGYQIISDPMLGDLNTTNLASKNMVTYMPKKDKNGTDSFTFKAKDADGKLSDDPATVNITINANNDVPVMKSAEITPTEAVVGTDKLTAVGTATDVEDTDASKITYSYQWKKNGEDIAGQTASTLAKGNYVKGDKVTVVIAPTDSAQLKGEGKESVAVEIGNTAPMATGKEFTIQEDQSLEITLSGTDADGAADIKGYQITSDPTLGDLDTTNLVSKNMVTYMPKKDKNGTDAFTFKAKDADGKLSDDSATVNITVNADNDAPVMTAIEDKTVYAGEKLEFTLSASDIDKDVLTYSSENLPTGATVVPETGIFSWIPAKQVGEHTITFTVGDKKGGTSSKNAKITVEPGKLKTVEITATPTEVVPDGETKLAAKGYDKDGNSIAETNLSYSKSWTASKATGDILVSVNVTDKTYKNIVTGYVTVKVTLTPKKLTSLAITAPAISVGVGGMLALTVTGSYDDGSTADLSKTVDGWNASAGVVDSATGIFSAPAAKGDVVISATKGNLTSNSLKITVTKENTPPVAEDKSVQTNEDTKVDIKLSGSDADGDALKYKDISQPSHGSLSGDAPNLTYTPAKDYNGSDDSFSFKVNDGTVDSAVAVVSLTVKPVNDAPTLSPIGDKTTEADKQIAFVITAEDVDKDVLNYSAEGLPKGASLDKQSGAFVWIPSSDQVGTHEVTFKVSDGEGETSSQLVNFTISKSTATKPEPETEPEPEPKPEPTSTIVKAEVVPAKLVLVPKEQITVKILNKDSNDKVVSTQESVWIAPAKAGSHDLAQSITLPQGVSMVGFTKVTVIPSNLSKIVVSPESISLKQGESITFTAKGYDVFDNERTETFSFASKLGNKANVTAKVAAGDYVMTVSKGSISATAQIKVLPVYKVLAVKVENGKVKLTANDASGTQIALGQGDYDEISYEVSGTEFGNQVVDGSFVEGSKEGAFTVKTKVMIGDQVLTSESTVNVNKGAPKMEIKLDNQELKDNLVISGTPKLKMQFSDGNGVGTVKVYVDGLELKGLQAQSASGPSATSVSFSQDLQLTAGTHSLVIAVEDALGTKGSVTISGIKVYADLMVVGTPMNYPNPFKPSTQSTTLNYKLSKNNDTKVMIYDLAGRMVYSKAFASGTNGGQVGENEISWDGKSFTGQIASNGVYVYFILVDGKKIGSGQISINE